MLLTAPQQVVAFDLSEGKLYRAILSNRQLEEQLVDFWYNHFNVFLDKGADRYLVPDVRARGHPPARAGQVPRPAGGHGQEPGDAVLSGQLAERRAGRAAGASRTPSGRCAG